MKTWMKKRAALPVIVVAALLALPGAAFAAADGAAAGDNITVEYRYAEGGTPDIPASISQFGQTYNLVGTSGAVLESTLPTMRNYTYRVSGAVTPEQLAQIQGAGDVAFTPVYIDKKEEADRYLELEVPTNDVEELPAPEVVNASEFAGTFPDGSSFSASAIAGVEFTELPLDEFKIPTGFSANILYRGVLTTPVLGYYLASANFTTSEAEDEINQYVVVAEYAPEALPPAEEEEEIIEEAAVIDEPAEPEAPLPTTGLSDDDVALVAGQGNNPFANIANGLTPLGGFSVEGVWSFLSLLMGVVSAIIAVFYAVGFAIRRGRVKNYEDLGVYDNEALALIKKRGNLLRILTILFGVLTLITWLILDDFTVGMVWVNANTIIVAVFFIVTVILSGAANARKAKADRYATEEPDTEIA